MSSFSGSWPGPVFGYNVLDHLLPLLRLDPNVPFELKSNLRWISASFDGSCPYSGGF